MSTPHNPSDDRSQEGQDHPENSGLPQYQSYPSTPHPEDTPNYGANYGGGYEGYGYGQPAYGQSAYGQSAYGQPASGQPQGTGQVQPMDAVGWAFRTVFRNWPLWIVGTVVLIGVLMGLSFLVEAAFGGLSGNAVSPANLGYQVAQFFLGLLSVAVTVFVYHGALRQVDKRKIGLGDFTDNVNFGPAFGLSLVLQIAISVIMLIIAAPFVMSFLAGNPIMDGQVASTDEDSLVAVGVLLTAVALIMLVAVLLAPLTMFMVWFVIDRRATFGRGIVEGFRAGLRNYGRLLAFNIVAGVVVGFATLITFGLALIVLAPALLLTQAMMFRQAAAGPLPASDQR